MYPPRTYPWHSWGRNDPLALENPIPPDPSVSETIPSVNRDRDLCSPRCAHPCIPRAYRRADRNEPSSPPQFYSIDNPRNYNPPPAPFLCRSSRSGPRPPPCLWERRYICRSYGERRPSDCKRNDSIPLPYWDVSNRKSMRTIPESVSRCASYICIYKYLSNFRAVFCFVLAFVVYVHKEGSF